MANKGVRLSLGKSVLFLALILGTLSIPGTTHAGFWSSIVDSFSGQDVSAQAETVIEASSQNISLPEPAVNINPNLKASPDIVIDGGEALISEVGPSTEAPEEMDNSNGQISIYIVRSGDTLAKVAEMFDVSVNTVRWANDLPSGAALKVGQTLVILPMSGVLHTVASGDTLNSIAKKYGGDIDEIAGFNDLKISDKLAVGDTIIIPDGQVSSSVTTSKGKTAYTVPDYSGYYMKPWIDGAKIHKTQGLHGYRSSAVDWGMPVGTPLWAAADGVVAISKNSGWNGGYGNYVIIRHLNNTQTIYGHMNSTIVSAGQTVKKGQLIGYSGNTGNSTGPHLHFEIRGAKNPF